MTKTCLVLACDDNFVPYTAVVARRVARLASEKFPIIVVSDGVSDENKRLAQAFCPKISFIEAGTVFESRPLLPTQSSKRAYCLRLLLDEILEGFNRAVYLDSDISVTTDITPLLRMSPTAAPIIASYDLMGPPTSRHNVRLGMSPEAGYFNSGVMICDLDAIRQEHIFVDALNFVRRNPNKCQSIDQDALNAVLNGRWQVLDWRWNALHFATDLQPKLPFIRHFAGRDKPWGPKKEAVQPRFAREWRRELRNSPWPGAFREETWSNRIRNLARPTLCRAEARLKSFFFGRSTGARGSKIKIIRNHLEICCLIEKAAAAGAAAMALPELAINS